MKDLHLADLFCGAGGTSTGAMEAISAFGYSPRLTAINHWDVAIATHAVNHPGSRHFCTSIDDINPRNLFKEGQLDLLWASPECTHHSTARGGKPINDQSRATAWCVVRWAEAVRPNVILVENVPEFETWGGIGSNNRPLKNKKGETFIAWVRAIESLGYHVDWRVLCAADYGDPTTRKRLFVQAVRGRRKITWPEPTHAKTEQTDLFGLRKAWVSAKAIIDWDLPGKSIYERKRPLSDKTMSRIMAGLEKFGLKPSIITMENGGSVRSADRPLPTITTAKGGAMAVAQPFLIPQRSNSECRSLDKPVPTVTTTSRGIGLAQPFLVHMRGTTDYHVKQGAKSVDNPLPTVTSGGGHLGLAQPFLVQVAHGNGSEENGDNRRVKSVDEPMKAVVGSNEWGIAEPFLIHTAHAGDRKIMSVDNPLATVTGNRGDIALCKASLLPQNQGGVLRSVEEPVPTVATAGAIGLVEPYLIKYYGTAKAQSVKDPLDSVTTKERHALVRPIIVIDGERYLLDIRFRMLQPRELAAAQGFRRDYKFTGNKTEQVKQIGNAVPRGLARALVLAVVGQNSDISSFEFTESAA